MAVQPDGHGAAVVEEEERVRAAGGDCLQSFFARQLPEARQRVGEGAAAVLSGFCRWFLTAPAAGGRQPRGRHDGRAAAGVPPVSRWPRCHWPATETR